MATATATWTQEQYEPGSTIRCDFTWSGAFYCSDDSCYARCTIEDAYGNELLSSRRQTASGSHYLSMVASAGTYVGRIYIWDANNCQSILPAEDTCLVQSTTTYTLNLVNSPSNVYGSIELIGHGTCPSNCGYTLPGNQLYAIEAQPKSGYAFSYWSTTPSGGCSSTNPQCTFNLNGNKIITAHFIQGGVTLTRSKSCDPLVTNCEYGVNPVQVNIFECNETPMVFNQIDSTGDLDGKLWTLQWWHSSYPDDPIEVWDINMNNTEGYTGWYACFIPAYDVCQTYGPGTCHIKHYCEGIYLGKSNDFTINAGDPSIIVTPLEAHTFLDTYPDECSTDTKTYRVTSDGDSPATTQITLTGTNANQFHCTNLTLPYTWPGATGTYQDVTVQFCPTSLGAKTATLQFQCSPCSETQAVTLNGTAIQPPPDFTVTPPTRPFPNQQIGTCSAPYQFTITNNTNAALSITITSEETAFVVTPAALTVPANNTNTFTIQFCPIQTMLYSTNIHVVCTACPLTIQVNVTGTGTTATTGACCIGTTCSITTPTECTGTFIGLGTDCDPLPCTGPLGACCIDGTCYENYGQQECTTDGGTWTGQGIDCDPDPCNLINCEKQYTKTACETAGCHWYTILPGIIPPTCHSSPEDPNTKYYIYGGIGLIGIAATILILKKIRRR